tara:strand:+ start:1609 stop:1890 length:282 start_codon:yes stop_codon:yes gene_type:complete
MSTNDIKEKVLDETLENLLDNSSEIVLYNDDVNTFDHVIDCLVNYCGHDLVQAEQCSHIVHYKGKCSVKRGPKEKLIPIKNALVDQHLRAKLH